MSKKPEKKLWRMKWDDTVRICAACGQSVAITLDYKESLRSLQWSARVEDKKHGVLCAPEHDCPKAPKVESAF